MMIDNDTIAQMMRAPFQGGGGFNYKKYIKNILRDSNEEARAWDKVFNRQWLRSSISTITFPFFVFFDFLKWLKKNAWKLYKKNI